MDEELVELVSTRETRPRGRKWVGLAMVIAGAVGVVGWTQINHKVSRLTQLSMMHHGLMRAFHQRGLEEAPDTRLRLNLLLNQVGMPEPTTMSISAEISESKDVHEWPFVTTTFKAKEGKQEELVRQVKDVVGAISDWAKEHGDEGLVEELEQRVEVSAGKSVDTVDIIVKLPKEEVEKKAVDMIGDGLKESKPTFTAEFATGRTIAEIFENSGENVVTLAGGLKASIDTEFASLMWEAGRDLVPDFGEFDILKGFAQFGTTFSFLYKSPEETEEAFAGVPSLDKEITDFKNGFAGSMPKGVRGPMKGLDEVADGLVEVKLTGLPDNYQIIATLNNCHIAPLIKAMIEARFHLPDHELLTSSTSNLYDCTAVVDFETAWSQEQKDFCCMTVGRGCRT